MAENARKRELQPSTSSKRKVLRVDSPSFEEEFNALLLALDQSDSEGDIEVFLVSDREILQLHESDQDEDLEENMQGHAVFVHLNFTERLCTHVSGVANIQGLQCSRPLCKNCQ